MPSPPDGVSVVLPVRNGVRWLPAVLAAIESAHWPGPLEIVAVDDGSTDGSRALLAQHTGRREVTVIDGGGRGAAAALNIGIRNAFHPLIAQIDQDVVIAPNWGERLAAALDDPTVAAAQGHYIAAA